MNAATQIKPTYLDSARITGVKHTQLPMRGQTVCGYGKRIPSTRMLQLDGYRWHRVYVMQWSNMGTPYVAIKGERHLLP